MPVTCRDIITRAMQKARILALGETPSAEESAAGLDELQNLYEQWGANGMFGKLSDTIQTASYSANINERIRITDASLVTLPETLEDDEEAPPYDTAFIEVIDTTAQTVTRHLFDAGQWVEIGGLTLDSEAPLASKGRSGLAACLAMSFAEEFGAEVGPGVLRQAGAFKTGLALKLGSDAYSTAPDYY